MKVFLRVLLAIISLVVVCLIYFNTNYYIRKQEWKDNYGSNIGAFIYFKDKRYVLKEKTIYINGEPVATILFCSGKDLIIKERKRNVTGSFRNKTFWFE